MSLPIFMRVFSKLAYQLQFPLETSRYALVAKALRYETAFSAIQKLLSQRAECEVSSELFFIAEKQGITT